MKYSEYRESVRENGNPIKHGLEGTDEPKTITFPQLFCGFILATVIFAFVVYLGWRFVYHGRI
jgi:hypothetical protein